MSFDPIFELSSLDGTNGFAINGISPFDFAGFSVSSAGDVNNDGIHDLIIGTSFADPNGNRSGQSYVIFGRSTGFPSSIDLSTLDGSNGFVLNGINAGDWSGDPVSGVGDFNNDGIDDFLIGAAQGGNTRVGEAYLVFGRNGGFSSSIELSNLDGTTGFRIKGIDSNDQAGFPVSGIGDINHDGIPDIGIGAQTANSNGQFNAGEAYVLFGRGEAFPSSFELSDLDGSNGFVLNGIDAGDLASRISAAGDVNGDGIDDFLVGASRADPNGNSRAGETYVVFGQTGGFGSSFELSSLNGNNGFTLLGIDANDDSGSWVDAAGDVNGDGFDDIIINAFGADPNGNSSAGEQYVIYGHNNGFSSSIDLSTLDGTDGSVINGIDAGDQFGLGKYVSGAGDINDDGFDDLIIGADGGDPNGSNSGESYVVYGRSGGLGSVFNLSDLDGTNGFAMNGINTNDRSGWAVSEAGDINSDGVDDIVIGTFPQSTSSPGQAYVIFGRSPTINPDYTIFKSEISGNGNTSSFTVELIDEAPVYKIDDNIISTQTHPINSFLNLAVESLGGTVIKNGKVNEGALEHFGGTQNPSIRQNDAADDVIISGSGVSGQFKADFDNDFAADLFESFSQDLLGKDSVNDPLPQDLARTKIFQFKGGTNGGTNKVDIFSNDEIIELNQAEADGFYTPVSFEFKWSGADTPGRRTTNNLDEFIQNMGSLFGGTQLSNGEVIGFGAQREAVLEGDTLNKVNLGNSGVKDQEIWEFGNQQQAQTFLTFFDSVVVSFP